MSAIKIRLAGYQPPSSILSQALRKLADGIARRAGGRVDIPLTENVTAAGQRADALLTMTEGDELDICYFSSSYLAARIPSLALFDRPFEFAERRAAYAELDGTNGRAIREAVAGSTGFHVLGFWDNGFRHISNARRPIRSPADCAGLRIRTVNNATHQAFFRRLGFEPVFIDIKDMVSAIAAGTVDAQENPLTNIVNFALQRYHRFVSLTGHIFGVALLLANRERFNGWPPEIKAAVQAAATDATAAQRLAAAAEDDACHRRLAAEGVEIIPASGLDRAAFLRTAGWDHAEAKIR
jgi:TRAP-type C4-dicarboxylate transport system substrate-binding protein